MIPELKIDTAASRRAVLDCWYDNIDGFSSVSALRTKSEKGWKSAMNKSGPYL